MRRRRPRCCASAWQQFVAPVFFLSALAAMALGAWLVWSMVRRS